MKHSINGSCHCGNIAFTLHTDVSPVDIELRRCTCTFCQRHNPRYWSDPDGQLDIRVNEVADAGRYRFGQGTADFVFCRRCGTFSFAIAKAANGHCAVINMNLAVAHAFRLGDGLLRPDGEGREGRDARRAQKWTPVASGWPLKGSDT